MKDALGPLGQIAIHVHDMAKMVSFYHEDLGIPLRFQVPGMSFFELGDIRLMFSDIPEPELDHPASVLYFQVDDINAQFQRLRHQGVQFDDKPHLVASEAKGELWLTFFRDPENNLLALMSYQ